MKPKRSTSSQTPQGLKKAKLGTKFTKGNEPSQPPKPQLPDEWNLIPFQT
jgi:hypothetical protein